MRVVLYGPPLVGKSSLLAAFAQQHGQATQQMDLRPGRGLLVSVGEPAGRIDFVSNIGAVWAPNQWKDLLTGADGAMLVLDAQQEREEANREYLDSLNSLTKSEAGCVVLAKADLVCQSSLGYFEQILRDTAGIHSNWPVFATRVDRPATLLQPFDWLLERLVRTSAS